MLGTESREEAKGVPDIIGAAVYSVVHTEHCECGELGWVDQVGIVEGVQFEVFHLFGRVIEHYILCGHSTRNILCFQSHKGKSIDNHKRPE